MSNVVKAVKKIISDSTPTTKMSATIVTIDDANLQVRIGGSNTTTQIRKPSNYNGVVGDVINVFKNLRTNVWEIEKGSSSANTVKLSDGTFDADVDLSTAYTLSSGIDETQDWIDIDAVLIVNGTTSQGVSLRFNNDSGTNYDTIKIVSQVDTVTANTTTVTTTTTATGTTLAINWSNQNAYKALIRGKIRNPGSTDVDNKIFDFEVRIIGGRFAGVISVSGVYKSASPITSFDISFAAIAGRLLAKNSTVYITGSNF